MNLCMDAITEHLAEAVAECFETVVFMDLRPGGIIRDQAVIEGMNLTATVCLAGRVSGLLALHCTENLGREIAQTATCSPEESRDEVCDAVGEMANMVAGNLKRRLSTHDDLFEIAVPSVIAGQAMCIRHAGAKKDFPRLLIPFVANDEHTFYVELQYRTDGKTIGCQE